MYVTTKHKAFLVKPKMRSMPICCFDERQSNVTELTTLKTQNTTDCFWVKDDNGIIYVIAHT